MGKSIEDLIKITTEENKKIRDSLEKVANNSDGIKKAEEKLLLAEEETAKALKSGDEQAHKDALDAKLLAEELVKKEEKKVKDAQDKIVKDDELLVLQKKSLGLSQEEFVKVKQMSDGIKAQELHLQASSDALKELGINSDHDKNFQKEQRKLDKNKLTLAKMTGSKDAEKAARDKLGENKMLTYMRNTAGFLGGIAKQGMQKVRSGLQGFSKFAFGALALAALSFLNSPKFDEYYKVVEDLIPAMAKFFDNFIKPLYNFLKKKLGKAFTDFLLVIKGEKDPLTAAWENAGVLAGLLAVFAPAVLLAPIYAFGPLFTKALALSWTTAAAVGGVGAFAGLLKVFGVAAILAGVVSAASRGMKAWADKSLQKEWGVDKISAAVGAMFGGIGKGISNAMVVAGDFALIGAGIGLAFPIPIIGSLIGGAIGGLIGAVMGYFGGEVISKKTQLMVDKIAKAWNGTIQMIQDKITLLLESLFSPFEEDIKGSPEFKREQSRIARGKFEFDERILKMNVGAAREDALDLGVIGRIGALNESDKDRRDDFDELTRLRQELTKLRKVETERLAKMNQDSGASIVQQNNNNARVNHHNHSSTNIPNSNAAIRLAVGSARQ